MLALLTLAIVPLSCVMQESLDGTVEICFATPGDEPDSGQPGSGVGIIDDTVTGEVVFHRDISDPKDWGLNCEATRALRIDDGENRWTVGYRAADARGNDVTPGVEAAVGTQVHVRLVRDHPFWIEHAFAITQDDSLLLAMDDGLGARFEEPLPGGLEVTKRDTYGRARYTCGRVTAQKLEFCADSCETVKVGKTATIDSASGKLGVRNVVAYNFVRNDCEDVTDIDAWTAWRK